MKNITRFVSILLCLLLGASTISCGFGDISDPLAENPELMNDAINNWLPLMPEEEAEELTGLKGRKAYHDGCIYYIDQYSTKVKPGMKPKWYTLFRYDMNTGVTSLACRDAACPHNDEFCPFFFQDTSIIKFQIVNDSLYFLTATYKTGHLDTSKKAEVYQYDLNTIKFEKLFEFDVSEGSTIFCSDEYIYYTQCDFHKNDNGYDQSVWSYDLNAGKKEKLFVFGDENDHPLYGRSVLAIDPQGWVVFMKLPADYEALNLYSTQTVIFECAPLKKGAKIETVVEIEAPFGVPALDTLYYHDGKVLFQELIEFTSVSLKGVEIERGLYDFSIRYVDVETGEFGTLLEHTTLGFDVAGDYLYTRPFMPEIIDLANGTQDVYLTGGKFIQFNMKTRERKDYLLGLGKNVEFYNDSSFTCVRGRLFGFIQNLATGEVRVPIEYDIATGEMRDVLKLVVSPPAYGYAKN